jgi:hypothetical protein
MPEKKPGKENLCDRPQRKATETYGSYQIPYSENQE